MADVHYTHPRLAAIYDLDSPWGADSDFYKALAEPAPRSILDLGCGTGTLCNELAQAGHRVTGIDPAAAMLEAARRKPYAGDIEWVQSTAQEYRSDERFDLIVMTGHAFQVLLTDTDVLNTFSNMRRHLAVGGVVAFESRNPAIDWNTRWPRSFVWELAEGKVHQSRSDLNTEGELVSFEHSFRFPDETLVSPSTLRFMHRTRIEALLLQSGLGVAGLYGDWNASPFVETSSPEMIFVARALSLNSGGRPLRARAGSLRNSGGSS